MYFTDRMALGNKLTDTLTNVRGTDTVLVCMKPSSMMVAVGMAIKLRAWILPLSYEKLTNPLDTTAKLGALEQSGEFCLNPSITENDYEYIKQEFMAQIEDQKREAMSRLNQAVNEYHGTTDPHILNNRTVILVGDVMMNSLELEVAKLLLKPLTPHRVYGAVGNVTIDVSEQFRINTDESIILDVLPSSVMGEDHYFENQDIYSDEEKQKLAVYIAQYWA